jgi:hypothetical protein
MPTLLRKTFFGTNIPDAISLDLGFPELVACIWKAEVTTFLMSMPKAAVNKQGDSPFWKNQIGPARQILTMQPETKTAGMKITSHD